MYAIVEIAGQQFKVEVGKKIFVHKLEEESGKKVEFDQVLLIETDGNVIVGEPVIKDALVEGKVLEQLRGDKVLVFKKKRKKGYRIKNGHRQYFTQIEIVTIKEKGHKKAAKKEETVAAAEVTEQPVAEKKPAAKKQAASKTTGVSSTKKPAEKKTAAKKSPKGESKE
jgi:large subunit ribosomal protein L21